MNRLLMVLLLSIVSTTAVGQQPAVKPVSAAGSESQGRLPVKRVVLYKNGIGYFEHSTRVRGTQELNIDFTTAQLNDVLKSLTVVDLGEGRITGVRFNSLAPLSERLKALRLPLGEEASRNDLLLALRGVRVEVRNGASTASGKVLSVETRKRLNPKGDEVAEVTELALMTEAGDLRSFELGPATTVHVVDRDFREDVGRYLDLIGSAKAVDLRRMTISAAGSGERDVFVSYISEVPVWESTYRILLPKESSAKPLLQGWAIVDNTIGEDWKDVRLSLVAGAPQSFVQNISQPYYVSRPVMPLPESVTLTPQTHEGTMKAMAPPPPPPPPAKSVEYMARAERLEEGVGGGVPGGLRAPEPIPAESPSVSWSRALEHQQPEAEAKGVGDQFEYDLKQKVTIGKNQSALVPILQAHIEAERVTLWNADSEAPLRALWINNTSGLTLDAGSFNVLDEETFAGEGMLDALHPGEKRLISYAADLAVRVSAEEDSAERPVSRVHIDKGVMVMTREKRESKKYTIFNSDVSPRQVVIEHPARSGWKLAGDVKPEESSASFHRFRVKAAPKQSAQLVVEEYRPEVATLALTNLTSNDVTLLTEQKRLTPAMEQAFQRVLAQKGTIAGFDAQLKARKDEVATIENDQGRLRENMKALKGSPEEKALVQRYTRQLDTQEDRLAALRGQISEVKDKREQARKQLDQILAEIMLDETF